MKFKLLKKSVLFVIIMISIYIFIGIEFVSAHEAGSPNVTQIHYSLRDDDGAEDAASFLNTDLSAIDSDSATAVDYGTNFRIRFQLSNEGTAATTTTVYTLQYAALGGAGACTSVASGNFADVPVTPTTEPVEMTTTSYYTDQTASLNCITVTSCNLTPDEGGKFQNGDLVEDPSNNSTPKAALGADDFTEIEYNIAFTSNATDDETYCFRASPSDTYSVIPGVIANIPAGITVSGNLYTNETGTAYDCSADTAVTIKVSVDGAAEQTADCVLNTGYFEVSANAPAGAGSEVVVYVDSGETPNATTVTLAADSSSNIIGLHMYQNRVAVTYEAGSSITNADLATADNTDAGIRYAVTGTDLLTDSGMELHVWTGKTYDPGGQVDTTSGDLHLDDTATAYIDTAGSVIDGDIIVDGGATPTTLQFQAATTVAGGAITTPDGGGTDAVINTSGSPTVTITGTGNIGGGTSPSITFSGLIIGTATAATTTVVSSMTVTGVLDVDTGDSLNINVSQVVTNTSASNAVIDGNITGAGTLRFTDASGGPGAGAGTLSAIVRYDASAGNVANTTFDARTYSGAVEVYADTANVRSVAMASGTQQINGNLTIITGASQSEVLTLDAGANPTVNVGGNLSFTMGGAATPAITSGTGTWTVSGSANLTNSTYTATAGNTLAMDGTGTLTTDSETLENLTINSTGTVTLAAATHTVDGNLVLGGSGTPTVTGSTISMTGTSNTITGGGKTLNILNIDPSSAGTITLQTSNLTVTSTLTVAAGDELSLNAVSLTHTYSSDVAGSGNITGTGTLIFDEGSGGPGTTITTLSSVVRFDASAGNIASTTFDARTYSDKVEIFSDDSAGAARSVAMANASYTLSGATSHLYVINNSNSWDLTLDGTLIPTVSIGGDLDFTGTGASSEAITTGTGTWTVSGNIDLTDGDVTFTTGTPDNTFQVNGTSKTITSDGEIFRNLSVTGTGDVSNVDLLTVAADFSIGATANFSHGNNANFLALGEGETAFVIANGGTWDASGAGTGILKMDGTLGDQWFDDQTDPGEQNMGNVQIGQSPGTTKLKADFAAANLTILNGDSLETHGWEVDIAGAIDCQAGATLDVEDNLPNNEGDGTIITAGGNLTFSNTCVYTTDGTSTIRPDGAVDQTFATGSLAFDDIYIDNSAAADGDDDVIVSAGTLDVNGVLTVNDGELDLESNDPTTDVEGDVIINVGGELLASSTGSINVAGLWNNNGTFTAGAGTGSVTFDSGDAETIDAGAQAFNIVVFDNAAGSWTIQNDNMTTNSDLTLTAATAFTLNAALTLEVKGDFTLTVVDVNTTWGAGSTLYLNGSGGMYNINTKGHGGDTFITLRIGASEDIAMWDSGATTFTIDAGGCLFSQDHAASAGRLNVYGTCNSRANEYWSYAKDFEDGAVVARQADVRFADGASLTVDNGETLEITGQNAGANRSFVTNQGAGNYGLTIDGTINARYYNFDYLDDSGVNITATATVTELADGNFDNAKAGAASSYITVTGINQTKEFSNCVFDDNGDGADVDVDYNVNADGANILWKFLLWDGNKGGESFDNEANNAIVDWSENLSFSISDNIMDLGVINTLIVGSDSHNLTVTTNAVNGYTCSAVEDGNIRNNGDDINDVADNTVEAGTEEYGISCSDIGDCQLGVNDVALTGAPLTVASNAGRVSASVTPVTYEAAADALTAGTTFSHVVTFTCAGDF
jgi:hypothetical protein